MAKVELLATAAPNESEATFVLHEEDHTLGNALRHVVAQNPEVQFVGYSAPHPSEDKIHFRIQTNDKSAIKAMEKGLDDLMGICKHVLAVVDAELGTSDEPPAVAVEPEAPADEDT